MTTDPERLLGDGSNVEPLERELLASVRNVHPPEGARERAWQGIAGQIAAGVVVGAAASTAAATAKAGIGSLVPRAIALKIGAVALAGGVAAGGYAALRSVPEPSAPAAPSSAPVIARPAHPQAVAPAPVDVAAPEPTEGSPQKRNGGAERVDQLTAESARLTEARALLRAGDASAAQAVLDRLQAQFPRGVLAQEREVLAIEVLAARGNLPAARARARAFVRAHPKSPHSEKLGRYLDGP